MQREIRPVTEDEFPEFSRVVGSAFGNVPTPEELEDELTVGELDRSLAVLESGQIVGGAGAYSFQLTAPGRVPVPAAGVTWVGVLPTHRRRGILTDLMARQLADVAERGEPVAILTASEGTIYGRYGYGVASWAVNVEVQRARGEFRSPPAAEGRIRLVAGDEARKLLPEVYDAFRRRTVGAITRSDRFWEMWFRDREKWREGASPRFVAVHESPDGVADGAAVYRVKEEWAVGENRSQLFNLAVFSTDAEVDAALWRFLLDIDLIATVKGFSRPVDEPLPWRLVDPRAYRVVDVGDWLWACLVDVPAALSARRYGATDGLTIEVVDRFRPSAGGRFRLDGGPDGAECRRTDAEPDLVLAAPELGATWLGGVRFSALRAARLVEERTAGAVARADALFVTDPAPYCNTGF